MSVRRGVGSVDADIEMTRSPGQRCKKIIGERAPAQTGLLPLFAVLPSRNIYYGPHLHKTAIYACLRALSLGELGRPSHAGQVASGAPLDPNAPIWPRHERWWTIESKTAYNGINVRWSNGVRVGRAALIGGWSKLLGREVVCNTQSKEGGKKGQKGDDKVRWGMKCSWRFGQYSRLLLELRVGVMNLDVFFFPLRRGLLLREGIPSPVPRRHWHGGWAPGSAP
ncbi:hypothetical protein CPSG_03248 [Coccidioides posadasii str. Silveira]|uniref:Uncharacterized protein n=1 Tax=Coccidioides posadasii (strain RMSCC 757 / Silveira) TaxID=443226 RepID=E9D169_COCPS|nr:hypothetical protein CPSG_03248 [Coccidioides posadasii str. Silveira]